MKTLYSILLGNKKNKKSVNEHNYLNINLDRSTKLLPTEDIVSKLSEYEQYIKEKDKCTNYRFIFTINTYASNLLNNIISEIVYREGGDDCVNFGVNGCSDANFNSSGVNMYNVYKSSKGKNLTREELIRDTSYSHPDIGPFVYHCGYDIFNNHILRNTEFSITCKIDKDEYSPEKVVETEKNFNTLMDYDRYGDGQIIKGYKYPIVSDLNSRISLHQYQYDTVLTMSSSITTNLAEENGWIGFKNKSRLNISNYVFTSGDTKMNISLNKCMNNNKAYEFIDLYPDRSLFSFVPKYNKYKNRPEYNWRYCITYPYENVYDQELVQDTTYNINGLECELITELSEIFSTSYDNDTKLPVYSVDEEESDVSFTDDNEETTVQDGGDEEVIVENATLTFRSYIKHNLSEDDYIKLYVIDGNGFKEIDESIEIDKVGYDGEGENYYFTIKATYLDGIIQDYIDGQTFSQKLTFRFRRLNKGKECIYYLRKFKRVPNFNHTEVYKDGAISKEELNDNVLRDFNTSLNNLAFSKTIYDDDVAQVIYNEDISLKGLKDNWGRDISELYFTIIKTNEGYKDWYGLNDDGVRHYSDYYTGEGDDQVLNKVEFSHCFGELTAGIDMPDYCDDYNVHKIHSISDEAIKTLSEGNCKIDSLDSSVADIMGLYTSPEKLGGSINISGDTSFFNNGEFYGDIVEFEPYTLNEIILDDVMFRFNTAQREYTKFTVGSKSGYNTGELTGEFANMWYDDIIQDDYDIVTTGVTSNDFTVEHQKFNKVSVPINGGKQTAVYNYPINLNLEGYYYKPHHRFVIKEYSDTVNQGQHTLVAYSDIKMVESGSDYYMYIMETAKNYYFNGESEDGRYSGDEIYLYNKRDQSKITGQIKNVRGKNFQTVRFKLNTDIIMYEYDAYYIKGETDESKWKGSLKDLDYDEKGYDKTHIIQKEKPDEKYNYKIYIDWTIFKLNPSKPDYAYELDDGTGRYLWREMLSESGITTDNVTYDMVFTNNKKYIYDNINLFVRRQDNTGEYGISYMNGVSKLQKLTIDNKETDLSTTAYTDEEESTEC